VTHSEVGHLPQLGGRGVAHVWIRDIWTEPPPCRHGLHI